MKPILAIGGVLLLVVLLQPRRGSKRTPGPARMTVNPSNGSPISSWHTPAMSTAQLQALVTAAGFPPGSVSKAVAIAQRESGGHPDAVVDTRGMSAADLLSYWGRKAAPEWSAGLWQVNVLAFPQYTVAQLQDPTQAAAAVLAISKGGSSWGPWGG